ncbi:MAG TPA: flagellar biosynthesis protein FlhB [Fibrobacteria bacterium]|nr:flagellar biosynthesis protein FlhB [Fibrobacteria bacterium]
MAAEDEGRTEDPTDKKKNEARKQGKTPRVQDLQQSATLFAAAIALWILGAGMMRSLSDLLVECFRAIPTWRVDDASITAWGLPGTLFILRQILPVAIPVALVIVVVSIATIGLQFNTEVIKFDPSKAFQFSLARLFGAKTWIELGKSALRMLVVSVIGFKIIWDNRDAFLEMAAWPVAAQALFTAGIALEAVLKMSVVLVVLGIADWFYQKRSWLEDLKMTKHEVKDEARSSEGDPQVKGKIRSMRREMHKRFMMGEVPKATVVVTNPTHFAVALRYNQGVDRSPVVVAKGADLVAKRIREIATEHGVPLVENPPLARALHAQVEPGDEIPNELYAAVAEVLAFVFRTGKNRLKPVAAWGILFAACAGALFQQGCAWPLDDADSALSVQLQVPDPSGEYRGGEVVVRAAIRRAGRDSTSLAWGLGRATLVSRGIVRDVDGNIVHDTLVLRWDTLPPNADTTGRTLPRDTLRYYAGSLERASFAFTVRNVLPRLDSMVTGPSLDSGSQRTVLPRQDTLVLAVHPGENALIRYRMVDPDTNWPVRWDAELPIRLGAAGTLAWRSGTPGDSVMLWKAPTDSLVDTTVTLFLTDGLGGGRQPWRLRLCTYREQGSVWAGTRSELVKIALTRGRKPVVVHRIRGFSEVVSMDIDPLRDGGTLLAVDRGAAAVRKFTSTGIARPLSDSTPGARSVSCDVDGSFCWVGGADAGGLAGRLSRIDGSTLVFRSMPGLIQSIAVDQNAWGRAWFASADSGFLGRTSGGRLDTILRGALRRPVSITWDESRSILWVADLGTSSVVAFDSSGRILRTISSVHRPVSVAASGGRLWVADLGDPAGSGTGEVRRYSHDGALQTRCATVNGPRAVVVDPSDPDRAWVADTENGRMVLLDGATEIVSTAGLGLDRPDLVAVHRGAP